MENYIVINGQKTELTDKMLEAMKQFIPAKEMKLADVVVGSVVKIGGRELLVLNQIGDTTLVISKDLYIEESEFGSNNNFVGSLAAEHCDKFAGEIAAAVGEENIVPHDLDLTSDDGLKDYGTANDRLASLLTADMYRKYVDILDMFKQENWWWLSTPFSTKRHENDFWIKCVAPSGRIYDDFYNGVGGVRPFCVLKSTIFVSD